MSSSHLDRRSFVGGLTALIGVSPALAAIPEQAFAVDAVAASDPVGLIAFHQIPGDLRIPLFYCEINAGAGVLEGDA